MKLHPHCHLIEADADILLCRGRGRLRLTEQQFADDFRRLVSPGRDQGTDAAGQDSWAGVGATLDLRSLLMVAELEEAGFLHDDTGAWRVPAAPAPPSPPRLMGQHVVVVGAGPTAQAAGEFLGTAGAQVTVDSPVDTADLSGVDLVVHCPGGPDLAGLSRLNDLARAAGVVWLPAFQLGDDGIVGPLSTGGASCFRCWELRWLGMAESTDAEVRLHQHLRAGAWRHEVDRDPAALACLGAQAGHLARRWLAGEALTDQVWITDFTTGSTDVHRLLAHPDCGRCRPAFTEPDPSPELAAWLAVGDRVADLPADLGPITDAWVGPAALVEVDLAPHPEREVAEMATAHARFAVPQPEDAGRDAPGWTHGAAADPDHAELVAVAEALERYCGIYVPRPVVRAAYDELTEPALWPPALPLYSERQYARPGFPFDPFDPGESLDWAWGYDLMRQSRVLVPQAAVRYGPLESRLVHESSSGVAAHTSPSAALLGACLEVVERDALMIYWLNRLAPPLVELDGTDAFVASAVEEVQRSGYQLDLADMTTDLGIPVVLAIARRTDLAAPALMLGAGAALDHGTAVAKALRELLGGMRGRLASEWTRPERLVPEDVRELADHARLYHHPDALARAAFLWSSGARTTVDLAADAPVSRGDQLRACIARLEAAGSTLVAVDLTTPDVAPHLRVFRAIVPGLQPIGFGRFGVRLGGRRLYEAPVAMGHASAPTSEASLNTDPHCFP